MASEDLQHLEQLEAQLASQQQEVRARISRMRSASTSTPSGRPRMGSARMTAPARASVGSHIGDMQMPTSIQASQARPMKRIRTDSTRSAQGVPMGRNTSSRASMHSHPGSNVGQVNSHLVNVGGISYHDTHSFNPNYAPNMSPNASFATGSLPTAMPTGALDPSSWLQLRDDRLYPASLATSPSTPSPATASHDYLSPWSAVQQSPFSRLPSHCETMPTVTSAEQPMTRSNSQACQSVSGVLPLGMLRLDSQASAIDPSLGSIAESHPSFNDAYALDDALLHTAVGSYYPDKGKGPAIDTTTTAWDMTNPAIDFSSLPNFPPQDMAPYLATDDLFGPSWAAANGLAGPGNVNVAPATTNNDELQSTAMDRTGSGSSTKSNASMKSRMKEALNRQNLNAKILKIAPLPSSSSTTAATTHSQSVVDDEEDTASQSGATKAKYKRPLHPKVKCNQCDEHPDGFRGDHELQRHIAVKHRDMVKKWYCRDPASANLVADFVPHLPIDKCKQCRHFKAYNVYYNAAAHLRRAHFKPKAVRSRGGPSGADGGSQVSEQKAEPEEEKRGGKGGGDWPPMSELKKWMFTATVKASSSDGVEMVMPSQHGQAGTSMISQQVAAAQMMPPAAMGGAEVGEGEMFDMDMEFGDLTDEQLLGLGGNLVWDGQ